MSALNKSRRKKEHQLPFRYSALYHNWRSAALAYDPRATGIAQAAHSRMIERLFGALDPWFYKPREATS